MCKSLAYDSPISLQTSFARMEQHPLSDDILALIKRYEALRHHQYGRDPFAGSKKLSEEDLVRLKTPGRDFVVDTDLWDAPMAVEMKQVPLSNNDVRAWIGSVGDATLLRLWHSRGREGKLVLDGSSLSDSVVITEDLRTARPRYLPASRIRPRASGPSCRPSLPQIRHSRRVCRIPAKGPGIGHAHHPPAAAHLDPSRRLHQVFRNHGQRLRGRCRRSRLHRRLHRLHGQDRPLWCRRILLPVRRPDPEEGHLDPSGPASVIPAAATCPSDSYPTGNKSPSTATSSSATAASTRPSGTGPAAAAA